MKPLRFHPALETRNIWGLFAEDHVLPKSDEFPISRDPVQLFSEERQRFDTEFVDWGSFSCSSVPIEASKALPRKVLTSQYSAALGLVGVKHALEQLGSRS